MSPHMRRARFTGPTARSAASQCGWRLLSRTNPTTTVVRSNVRIANASKKLWRSTASRPFGGETFQHHLKCLLTVPVISIIIEP